MKEKIFGLFGLGLLVASSGCSIYSTSFECKPGKGLGCTSAWDVSDMIIENSKDEDPFDSTEHRFEIEEKS